MKRERMDIERLGREYERAERLQQSRRFLLGFAAVLRTIYRPNFSYAGAAKEKLAKAHESGQSILFALNHRSTHDPNVALAALSLEPTMRRRIGRIGVLAKSQLFEGGPLHPQPHLMRAVGAIPVERPGDHPNISAEELRQAGGLMTAVAVKRLRAGGDLGVFLEGTCNPGDPRELLGKVNTGAVQIGRRALDMGRLQEGVTEAEDIAEESGESPWLVIVPAALSYGVAPAPVDLRSARRASFVLGEPIDAFEDRSQKPFQTTRVLKERLTDVLQVAHADYHERRDEAVPEWYESEELVA